jgi:hypothetical protein
MTGRKSSIYYDSAMNGLLLPVAEKTGSSKKLPRVPYSLEHIGDWSNDSNFPT